MAAEHAGSQKRCGGAPQESITCFEWREPCVYGLLRIDAEVAPADRVTTDEQEHVVGQVLSVGDYFGQTGMIGGLHGALPAPA